MAKKLTSLENKRQVLISSGIIKDDFLENIWYQHEQPHGFTVTLCGHCTFECSYCPNTIKDRPQEFMDTGIIEKLIDETREIPSYYMFSPRGESLLHPDFVTLMCMIKESNSDHFIGYNTNGLLMNKKYRQQVLECGIGQVTFSMQSIEPGIYSKLTNYPNCEEIIDNVIKTIELRDRFSLDVIIAVQFLDNSQNTPHFKKFEKFWSAYDVFIHRQKEHSWGGRFEFGRDVDGDRYPCMNLWLQPKISHRGEVCICYVDFFDEYIYGDLRSQSLSEIWKTSTLRRKIIKAHMSSRWSDVDICKDCVAWKLFPNIFERKGDSFELPAVDKEKVCGG